MNFTSFMIPKGSISPDKAECIMPRVLLKELYLVVMMQRTARRPESANSIDSLVLNGVQG